MHPFEDLSSSYQETMAWSDSHDHPTLLQKSPITHNEEDSSKLSRDAQHLWELAVTLFLSVCSPVVPTSTCLTLIEELSAFLRQCDLTSHPSLLISLDVIVQKAMYELSDKIVRPPLASSNGEVETTSPPSPMVDSLQNIEDCVSMMTYVTLPLCQTVQNQLDLNFLTTNNHGLGSKMQTLNRQLQELCSWTSLSRQSSLPTTFLRRDVDLSVELETPFGEGGMMSLDPKSSEGSAFLTMLDNSLQELVGDSTNPVPTGRQHGSNSESNREYMESFVSSALSRALSHHCKIDARVQSVGISLSGSVRDRSLDFVAMLSNVIPTIEETQYQENEFQFNLQKRHQLEEFISLDRSIDDTFKHLRACISEVNSTVHDVIQHIFDYFLSSNSSNEQVHPGSYDDFCTTLRREAEILTSRGEFVLKVLDSKRTERFQRYPILPRAARVCDSLTEIMEREDKDHNISLRKLTKQLEKPLRDVGFQHIKSATTRLGHVTLSFTVPVSVLYHTSSNDSYAVGVTFDNSLPILSSHLIQYVLDRESTGKLNFFMNVIRKFVREHNICNPTNGFLSLYGWNLLVLHFFLRQELITPIPWTDIRQTNGLNYPEFCGWIKSRDKITLLEIERRRSLLRQMSMFELLDGFFRYYVSEFDTFTSVVTVYGNGERRLKSEWRRPAVLWRLSIEDPCSPMGSRHAVDLGTTLSRPGQLTTFKALRRAVYGIRSIVASGYGVTPNGTTGAVGSTYDTPGLISKLFQRGDLIKLARKSEYVGASNLDPRPWISPIITTNLTSPQNDLNSFGEDDVRSPISTKNDKVATSHSTPIYRFSSLEDIPPLQSLTTIFEVDPYLSSLSHSVIGSNSGGGTSGLPMRGKRIIDKRNSGDSNSSSGSRGSNGVTSGQQFSHHHVAHPTINSIHGVAGQLGSFPRDNRSGFDQHSVSTMPHGRLYGTEGYRMENTNHVQDNAPGHQWRPGHQQISLQQASNHGSRSHNHGGRGGNNNGGGRYRRRNSLHSNAHQQPLMANTSIDDLHNSSKYDSRLFDARYADPYVPSSIPGPMTSQTVNSPSISQTWLTSPGFSDPSSGYFPFASSPTGVVLQSSLSNTGNWLNNDESLASQSNTPAWGLGGMQYDIPVSSTVGPTALMNSTPATHINDNVPWNYHTNHSGSLPWNEMSSPYHPSSDRALGGVPVPSNVATPMERSGSESPLMDWSHVIKPPAW